MKWQTLSALRKSIKKWEAIVAGGRHDGGSADCDLCKLFGTLEFSDCAGCPVSESGPNRESCRNTPYVEWFKHCSMNQDLRWFAKDTEAKKLAKKELTFLKSLLPKNK